VVHGFLALRSGGARVVLGLSSEHEDDFLTVDWVKAVIGPSSTSALVEDVGERILILAGLA
jgi:hypothetical protein